MGPFILTFTGKKFYPLDPRPEDICIQDIAHSLSLTCRWTGHCHHFYSVAEHSYRVAEMVESKYKKAALLHDASEAYICDLSHPLKHYSGLGDLYMDAEYKIMCAINEKFNIELDREGLKLIKKADDDMLEIEMNELMLDIAPTHEYKSKYGSVSSFGINWRDAEYIFLEEFNKCF